MDLEQILHSGRTCSITQVMAGTGTGSPVSIHMVWKQRTIAYAMDALNTFCQHELHSVVNLHALTLFYT